MTHITINHLGPEYAGMIFRYFSILNRHELPQVNHNDLPIDANNTEQHHREVCLPTSIHISDGAFEYELSYDVDDDQLTQMFIAKFTNFDCDQDIIPLIGISHLDNNLFIGHTIGIPEHKASHIVRLLVSRSIAMTQPITKTCHKIFWN